MAAQYGMVYHMRKPAEQIHPKNRSKAAPLRSKAQHRYSSAPGIRKITVSVPEHLLEHAEMGTTELIREALKWYRHKEACDALLALRGKVKFGMTYQELKDMRD